MWLTLIFSGTALVFFVMTISALWHLRWVHRLPALEALHVNAVPQHPPIRCSIIVAARDEAARIEQTIRHLQAQRGIEAEIIVVDDRSVDGTSEILRHLAQDDARVHVKRVDVLPENWLGKCHACHLGANAATGDWILFTDADCWLKPDVIQRAILLAERDGVDHVAMTPGTVAQTAPAKAWHLMFLISAANWLSGVNRNRPQSYLGVGAFNLMRTPAYRQCGGYEALRLTVVDDVKLGLLLRRAGKKTRGFLGASDVECHWGTTVRDIIKVMEKNYFAVLDFRLGVTVALILFAVVLLTLTIVGLVSGAPAGLAAALAPLSLIVPAGILAHRLGWSWRHALLTPFMLPVFFYAVLNSTFVTLRQGGVRWRDTFYSLETLRAGNVR